MKLPYRCSYRIYNCLNVVAIWKEFIEGKNVWECFHTHSWHSVSCFDVWRSNFSIHSDIEAEYFISVAWHMCAISVWPCRSVVVESSWICGLTFGKVHGFMVAVGSWGLVDASYVLGWPRSWVFCAGWPKWQAGITSECEWKIPHPFCLFRASSGHLCASPNCRGCTRLPSRVCNSELVVAAGRVRGSSGSNSSVWRGFICSGIQQFVGSRSPAFLTPLPAHWCVCDFAPWGLAAYNADLFLEQVNVMGPVQPLDEKKKEAAHVDLQNRSSFGPLAMLGAARGPLYLVEPIMVLQ